MSSSLFCYLLCLLAAAQSNPVIDRQTVFQTPIENNQWMENLKNPCRSGTNAAKNLTILNIDGREAEIRIMSGNILSRLNSIKNQMVRSFIERPQCLALNNSICR